MRLYFNKLLNIFFETCSHSGKPIKFRLKSKLYLILFPLVGLLAITWILIRVLPKPQRAEYPCVKAATPIASSFILYILSFFGSAFAFSSAKNLFKRSKTFIGILFLAIGISLGVVSFLLDTNKSNADTYDYQDPLGPNNPIGKAKGVFPGRVVWAHDPNSTNENCKPAKYNDGYFLDKNCSQDVVDQMLAKSIMSLAGKSSEGEAWNAIFSHFNSGRNKGNTGYKDGEIIFIKINSVHASSGSMNSDYSIKNNSSYGLLDTSPQAVLALLKQLINKAGVPQKNIYVGDPFRDIFKHCFDKWHAEFPDVNYCSQNSQAGRKTFVKSTAKKMYYSDKKTVLDVDYESYYKIILDADYIINLPVMKGHRWGGVTFFAKNHFGSITRSSADHLHKGLHRTSYEEPLREGYKKYRVLTDIMGNDLLGGKTLLYMMDALWAASYEHNPPEKFQSAPFNNDWCSSFFVSLDPVAIESVCLDVLQAEYTEENTTVNPPRYAYVRFDGVDDYLHQAADSSWWPENIIYDPEGDGTSMKSLGVHEHWNNPADRKYSRNLGTGKGIELVEISQVTNLETTNSNFLSRFELYQNYPNPFNPLTKIIFDMPGSGYAEINVFDITGKKVCTLFNGHVSSGRQSIELNSGSLASGIYFCSFKVKTRIGDVFEKSIKMSLMR